MSDVKKAFEKRRDEAADRIYCEVLDSNCMDTLDVARAAYDSGLRDEVVVQMYMALKGALDNVSYLVKEHPDPPIIIGIQSKIGREIVEAYEQVTGVGE